MTDTDTGERQKLADAIREYFKSIGSSAVVSSDGIERVYYSGFSLMKLADAINSALRSPSAQSRAGELEKLIAQWPHSIYTEFHLENWTAADFAKHVETTLKTVRWLVHLEKEIHRLADSTLALTEGEREALADEWLARWEPSEANPTCKCSGDVICAFCSGAKVIRALRSPTIGGAREAFVNPNHARTCALYHDRSLQGISSACSCAGLSKDQSDAAALSQETKR